MYYLINWNKNFSSVVLMPCSFTYCPNQRKKRMVALGNNSQGNTQLDVYARNSKELNGIMEEKMHVTYTQKQ